MVVVCYLDITGIMLKRALWYDFPKQPLFLCVCNTNLWKTLWEKEKFLFWSKSHFPMVFSILLENSLSVQSNLKLLSANSFSLREPKIYHLGKS